MIGKQHCRDSGSGMNSFDLQPSKTKPSKYPGLQCAGQGLVNIRVIDFLDRGIVHVDVFMKTCFYPRLQHYIMQQVWNDPKSCLQQCCLTLRPEEGSPDLPEYKVVNNGSNSISKSRYKGRDLRTETEILKR